MSEVRNLILAVVASVAIMLGWKYIYGEFFAVKTVPEGVQESESLIPEVDDIVDYASYSDALKQVPRVELKNSKLAASVSLRGALIDDASLVKYRVSLDKNSENVLLMSPEGTVSDSMVEFGWVDPKHVLKVPGRDTVWALEDGSDEQNFTIRWDNGEGLIFRLKFSVDQDYMLTVAQEVINNTDVNVHLAHYGRINRAHSKSSKSFWISHEGAIGSFGHGLKEWTYKNLEEAGSIRLSGVTREDGGRSWIGFADKYWFTALIPSASEQGKLAFRTQRVYREGASRFQVDYSKSHGTIGAHDKVEAVTHLFMGAKELELLDQYKDTLNIPMFDKAVDFGMLYFITKPVFLLLQYFHKLLGNFGLAIVMLTVAIKLVAFPLSMRSYVSMFKLKRLQPEVLRIKELYKTDDLRISKEIASLFKKHKVSPLSGFLPVLIQIPIFFALYKVLFVTIEMRHAPLFGWIRDLSSQDTANFLNLFGLIPLEPPFCIGVLPVVLGLTMVLQQKVMQKDQATPDRYGVMKFLPYIFVFVFSSFPSGLVLYWICSNVITILQQIVIRYFVCRKELGANG
ncbi:membrane protein insertase YidC [Anaplasma phagocytophilum]|uniref:Membrane protein insertase YidC n=5 Tax=Anaplasma phagocytophilum TaxID=948 RepID=Q2GKG8_ANAPZ|nr:membrane protein insertase YidC [Anaplasma phagocytophilum]ABD44233.1 inner membrane protein, 60 kDa [Anaplasma phagocytophilum str. HZ]AGR78835.1 insertase [Anaplasma phagocytophilum str. HZ2]AGR80082.1 insertase [Anaplasma phagocytophilum str. JM]AGR81337.1 insertase [Anaplasma phagocytophilum str. Dog2]EOA60886.1 membrane protein insertase [Anaplasma phagocytophilum str. HGE1]